MVSLPKCIFIKGGLDGFLAGGIEGILVDHISMVLLVVRVSLVVVVDNVARVVQLDDDTLVSNSSASQHSTNIFVCSRCLACATTLLSGLLL